MHHQMACLSTSCCMPQQVGLGMLWIQPGQALFEELSQPLATAAPEGYSWVGEMEGCSCKC